MPTLARNRLLKMVNKYGMVATLSKPSYGAYDPTTGGVTSGIPTTYEARMYFANYDLVEMANNSVVKGDRKVLIPYLDTNGNTFPEPSTEDAITGIGDPVKVVSVNKLYSGDTLVCYICQVRE
jgi:hypothetical protein